jgi:DNA polymerase III delta subunit
MAKVLKMHPFVVKKNLAIVKKYSTEKLKKIYADLLDIDIKTKTGFAEQAVLMDLFVGRI